MGTICEEKKCIYRNNKSYNHCGTCAGLYDEPLIAKTESVAKSPACNDGLGALLETWKEALKGFDKLIEEEKVRDLRLMLMGSQNATKELVEGLELFIKEST